MPEDTTEIFKKIFLERSWPSSESVSGAGSDFNNTERLIRELPGFLRRLGVQSMLDVPCGDFNWMRHVDLSGISYTGADIVAELVVANQARYASEGRRFIHLDLLRDRLPDYDLILCRDCLFHFSHEDAFTVLRQIANTSARYLLTTTFTYQSYPRNIPIATGQWTPINLEMEPYSLGPPKALLVEGSNESISYSPDIGTVPMYDRCLGLWEMDSVRARLNAINPVRF